jgi:hypothetical protein
MEIASLRGMPENARQMLREIAQSMAKLPYYDYELDRYYIDLGSHTGPGALIDTLSGLLRAGTAYICEKEYHIVAYLIPSN